MPAFLSSLGLKIGVAVAAFIIISTLWLDNGKLRAEVKAAQAQTAQEAATCNATIAQTAAQANAQAAQAVTAAQNQANLAEEALQSLRAGVAAGTIISDNAVTQDAAKPGNDASIAPVLLNLNKALGQ